MRIPTEHVEFAEEEDTLILKHWDRRYSHHLTAIDRLIVNHFYNIVYHRGEDGRLEAANNWHRSKNL